MEVRGLEALLRWEHERYGVIAPCEFIPYAEQSGIISEVGQWVIGEALQGFKRMQEEIPELRYVSVNVSPSQLKDDGLVDCIKKVFEQTGMVGENLVIELTEAIMVDNYDRTRSVMEELNRDNILIAIDDFGIGFSSMFHLGKLPIQIIKINKEFNFEHEKRREI